MEVLRAVRRPEPAKKLRASARRRGDGALCRDADGSPRCRWPRGLVTVARRVLHGLGGLARTARCRQHPHEETAGSIGGGDCGGRFHCDATNDSEAWLQDSWRSGALRSCDQALASGEKPAERRRRQERGETGAKHLVERTAGGRLARLVCPPRRGVSTIDRLC